MLLIAVAISSVAAYYSIAGLTAIFSAAVLPVIIMGAVLEAGKIAGTVWLHNNWQRAGWFYKTYLIPAIMFLMLLTSLGIFGFLSKAHNDQNLVSGDVQSRIAIYDEKIKTARENIDSDRKQLSQMDAAVDQIMARSDSEKGADKANTIRKSQQRDRSALAHDIEANQKLIISLNDEAAPIRAEVRKVNAEVGPIKYIAAFIYGPNPDENLLERAVTWMIILIVIVFDPLALCLILAANRQLEWARHGEGGWVHNDPYVADVGEKPTAEEQANYAADDGALTESQIEQIKETVKESCPKCGTPMLHAAGIGPFCPNKDCDVLDGPKLYNVQTDKVSHIDYEFLEEDPSEFDPHVYDNERLVTNIDKSTIAQESVIPPPSPVPVRQEVGTARGRGQMYSVPAHPEVAERIARPYNVTNPSNASHSDFGNEFPVNPNKGDVYLRTDYLPNRLFKFNGAKWIEVDKDKTDIYAYDELYIKHLVNEIDTGRYDVDTLTSIEREQIADYLKRTN